MIDYLIFLLIPVMSWLDRQRGTPKVAEKIPKLPALLGMGYLCALATGHAADWQTVVIALAVVAAHGIGFGQPIGYALTGVSLADDPNPPEGARYEPWQVTDLLKRNPWVALTVRGVMVGAATLLAGDWVASALIALAFGVAFPLASYIVRYRFLMPTRTPGEAAQAWAEQEEVRGGLIGFILAAGYVIG